MAEETFNQRIDRERNAATRAPFGAKTGTINEFRDYARGVQHSTLTEGQREILAMVLEHTIADNVCRMVLLACTSRLQITTFSCPDERVLNFLHDLWTLAALPLLSKQANYATARDGNHAIILSWDNVAGRVRLTREPWWDGRQGTWIAYDEADQPLYAVKEWTNEAGNLRRVVYFADRIERYIWGEGGWGEYSPDEQTPAVEAWPAGTLPVVHFANVYTPSDKTTGDTGSVYGISELDGGVLGLQDEINDIQRDITAAARFTAYQQYWATGYRPPVDKDGKQEQIQVGPGAFHVSTDPAARFGTLAAGDLSQLKEALLIKLQAVSRMTATPLHMISNDWPSGEALLRAEQPLVEKVLAMAEAIGPAWSSLMHKATILANIYGKAGLDTDAMITTVFAPPDRRDPLTLATLAKTISPFVSRQEVLRKLGYSPDQITAIMAEMAEEAANTAATNTAATNTAPTPPAPGQEQGDSVPDVGGDGQVQAGRGELNG